MIGRERGVGGAARQLHRVPAAVDDELGRSVAAQHAAHEADVVQKAGDDQVTVILRFERLRQGAAEQDVAADRGHQHGMLEVVVEGVAPSDALDRDSRQRAHALGQIVVRRTEDFAEVVGDQLAEPPGRHGRNCVHCHTPHS
jgi:hypothetical protein